MPSEITTDPEVFQQCTDTIIRQVGDIGRMVDEFSSFARMPTPVMRRENAQELRAPGGVPAARRQSRRSHSRRISRTTRSISNATAGSYRQALTNVLKNATEGIAAREAAGRRRSRAASISRSR